jgi:hypothetical protein
MSIAPSPLLLFFQQLHRKIHDSRTDKLSKTLRKSINNTAATHALLQDSVNHKMGSVQVLGFETLDAIIRSPVITQKINKSRNCEEALKPWPSCRVSYPQPDIGVSAFVARAAEDEVS